MVYKVSVTRGGKPTLPRSGFPDGNTLGLRVVRELSPEEVSGAKVHLAAKRVPDGNTLG
jgi:hypothetical protein